MTSALPLCAITKPPRTKSVVIDGYAMKATEVLESYWYLAVERQNIFMRRFKSEPEPWTDDSILKTYRFTNAYRASDRVSQYLLRRVIYNDTYDGPDIVFRTLLFKIFNRIATWEHLIQYAGEPTISTFNFRAYSKILDIRLDRGKQLYSAAYIMPNPKYGFTRKHRNHLALLENLIRTDKISKILKAKSLENLYHVLTSIPSFGPFLAYQYAIDLNYSPYFSFDEMDYVVPGPGALRGIAKCFTDTGGLGPVEVIRAVTNAAPEYTASLSEPFIDLWGRPLQLVDCQNLFCEVDKYARVAYPNINKGNQPSRIKQNYISDPTPLILGYPPKWELPLKANQPSPSSITSTNSQPRPMRSQTKLNI